jgi:hypothetical protein
MLNKDKKAAEAAIKRGIKLYMKDALETMQHTQDCTECEEKFNKIIECSGSQFKAVTHIPKCKECQQLFNEIANHAKNQNKEVEQNVPI